MVNLRKTQQKCNISVHIKYRTFSSIVSYSDNNYQAKERYEHKIVISINALLLFTELCSKILFVLKLNFLYCATEISNIFIYLDNVQYLCINS